MTVRATLAAALAALLLTAADASGTCLRCHEDFTSFANRRGGGGGNLGALATATLVDGTGAAIATTTSNYNEASPGWRAVTELPQTIRNGVANFFIGTAAPHLGMLLQRRRTQTTGAADVGPMLIRASTTLLTPTATGMCTGAYAGVHYIAEKYGVVRDFTQLSVRVSAWNPGVLSGGIGLVFSHSQTFSATTSYALTQYVAVFRGRQGGAELCAGVYKLSGGTVLALTGQSTTISSIPGLSNTFNPANATEFNRAEWSRVGVSKTGGTIRLWVDTPSNIIHTVTDPSPLPAGAVGISAIGMNSAVFDDFTLYDAPTCNDGIWNGEETGTDCGGTSGDAVCRACTSETLTHDFGTQGVVGWHQETYCTSGGSRFPQFESGQIRYITNCAYDWPGTTGVNQASWGSAWFMVASKWPPAKDVDITITNAAGDNDSQGLVWRWQDRDNYYVVLFRSETRPEGYPVSIQRRRNGVNTLLWAQVPMAPQPHDEGDVQYFRVSMSGNVITVWTNRDGGTTLVQIATVTDLDPLDVAGFVGHTGNYQSPAVNMRFSYTINRPAVVLPSLPTGLAGLTAAAQTALGFYGDPTSYLPAPLGSLRNFRGLSVQGFDVAGSPFTVGTAFLPGVEEGLSSAGAAITFAGNQVLWSSSRTLGDTSITGMTVLLAFIPRGAGVTAGSAGVVIGKGLRTRPYQADASGWRLQIVNVVDQPVTGATSSQILQFYAQTGVAASSDQTATLAHPIEMDGKAIVVAIRVRPISSSGDLNTRTFTVDGAVNGQSFMNATDNTFTGTVSSSLDGLLSIGGSDIGTDDGTFALFETLVFSTSISDTDLATAQSYLVNKYTNTTQTCPDISSSQDGAVVLSGTCASAADGATCTLGCAADRTLTAGSGVLTCRSGRWVGSFPRCESVCPALSAVGTGGNGCRSMIAAEQWGYFGQVPLHPFYRHWNVRPVPATGAASNWYVDGTGVVKVSSPPLHRYTNLLSALWNAPTWASSSASVAITQNVVVPRTFVPPVSLLALPRYQDPLTYYAVEFLLEVAGANTHTLNFKRVRGGVTVTLCSLSITLLPDTMYTLETVFTLGAGGTGSIRAARGGSVWCQVTESAANFIAAGTAGYGLQALPGFPVMSYGVITAERLDAPCPLGCSGVVTNGTCTLPCNTGTLPRGDQVRRCRSDGSWSGLPLVCDNGAPALSDVSVNLAELFPVGAPVGTPFPSRLLSGKDGSGTIVFELVGGNTGGAFSIDSCTGQVRVAQPDLIDFEQVNPGSANAFTLRVRGYVAGSSPVAESFANMAITVTNANDPPRLNTTECTVPENSASGSPVCTLAVVDPDVGATASATLSFAFEEVPGLFSVQAATGALSVGDIARLGGLNFEAKNSYRLVVRVTDTVTSSLFSQGTVIVRLQDVPEAPTVLPTCAIDVDAATMATAGTTVPGFNARLSCVRDEDVGSSIATVSATVTSNPLVFILATGEAQVIQSRTYTGATPYLRDGRLVVDYGTMSLSATDNTGRLGTGTIRVYVLANVSAVGPVLRTMIVSPMTTAAGSGNVAGEYLMNTDGRDTVTFTGDNLLYDVRDVLTANVTTSTGGFRWWNVSCRYAYTGAVSGSLPLADGIVCPTSPGWGRDWSWTLFLRTVGQPIAPILSTIALVSHYARPVVTALGPPGQAGQPMNYATAGGGSIQVTGYNLGPSGTPITVDFGLVDAATQAVTWSSDMVTSIVPGHTTAVGRTRPGAGANMQVRVNVGGQTVTAPTGVFMTYLAPRITNIQRVGTTGLPNGVIPPVVTGVRTLRAGEIINITGTNFGPSTTQGMRLAFGLPATPNDNLPYIATCYYPSAASSHTNIYCTAPPAGAGTYTAILTIAGQQSPRTAATPVALTVQYHTAHVATVTGPGARLADTRGGQLVYFNGFNFGPRSAHISGVCPKPRAFYGMSNGTAYTSLKYEMTDCEVLDELGTQISCRMVEGTGYSPPYWRWSITSCGPSGWTGLLGTIRYAPPIVTGFEQDAGATAGNTRGGSAVTIYGRNFGPSMDLVSVRYYAPITGPNGVVRDVLFNATGCTKPDPAQMHEKIVCNLAPGAGSNLRWEVVVETQVSVQPTMDFKPPVITAVSSSQVVAAAPVSAADATLGGSVVYIHGTNFGPAVAGDSGRPLVQWVRFGPGGVADDAAYTVRDWSLVVPHNVIRAVIPPGIGKLLSVQVSVANVETGATAAVVGQTVSYADPRVAALEPPMAGTRGGVIVKAVVQDSGLLDPTTAHALYLNGRVVPIVDRFPSLANVLAAEGDVSKLTVDERDPSKHYLAFLLPEGTGAGLAVSVSAYRTAFTASTAASSPALDGPVAWFQYDEPVITLVAADRLPLSLAMTYNASGDLTAAELAGMDSWRILTILGSNLGPGATYSNLEMQAVDASGMPVDATFLSGSAVVVDVLEWSHERIQAVVKLPAAIVRLSMASVDPRASNPVYGSGNPVLSNTYTYLDVAPSVLGIANVVAGGYSTAGGQTVAVDVAYISSFNTLSVVIGNSTCDILTSDAQSVVAPSAVLSTIIQPQFAAQTAQGLSPSSMVFRLVVRVPPGQGSAVPIVVVRDNTPGTGAATIAYARPTLASLSVLGAVARTAASSTLANPFRVPTPGAVVLITGTNLGTCPVLVFGSSRVTSCAAQAPAPAMHVLSRNHTHILVSLPPGAGAGVARVPAGLPITVTAGFPYGDQDSAPVVYGAYGLPTITGIIPMVQATGMPTEGGVRIAVAGSNFGPSSATLPNVTVSLGPGQQVPCSNVARDSTDPHNLLTCTLPEGSGARLSVTITVEDQLSTTPGVLSYDAPLVTALINANETARSTAGGYTVVVRGSNFGPRQAAGHCLFVPFPGVPGSSLVCNGAADSWDEAEVVDITSWNHSVVQFTMPAGMGVRQVRLAVAGALSSSNGTDADVFRYDAPVVTKVTPATADTDGATEITVEGRNFGFGSTASANADRLAAGYVPRAPVLPAAGQEGAYPSPFALRANFFSAQRCITSAVLADTPDNTPPASVATCFSDATGYGVVTHTHTKVVFKALPGVGKNRTLSLSIVNPDGSDTRSNGVAFSYTPPSLDSVSPNEVQLKPPALVRAAEGGQPALYSVAEQPLMLTGKNFGPVGQESTWTAEERVVQVFVGGAACADSARTLSDDNRGGFKPVLECNYGRDTDSGVALSSLSMPVAGYAAVEALVAGQRTSRTADDFFAFHCAQGSYGLPGEVCEACPFGAQCDGHKADDATVVINGKVQPYHKAGVKFASRVTPTGLNVTECVSCHTQPRALPGFFNMKGYVNGKGESESICTPLRKDEGKRTAVQCENVVACDPPESCLGDNVCSDGYANKEWPYRCAQCADGFYRSAGSCRKCPDNPALNIVFFFVAAVVAIGAGWLLNQKQINIAFLTIGLDYMQVISIFANTRVTWPPQIKELFRILSAFNLNIEIVAPECAFTGLKYGQKWGMIMALPIAVNALLLVIHVLNVAWAMCIERQGKKVAGTMASPLIAMAQVLMYFLYLYLTRSVFDIFTCRSAIPAEYDSAGNEITYMAGVVERCGVKGGTQEQLLPGAVVALLVYVLGYPGAIAANLWTNRDLVMEDQLLRAKRTGDDRMSNPHALEFRRRFARTYYQFRPDMFLWVLAILLRKFLIAISSLVFSTNANFQMAAMLLVLFLAYAAQVRFRPYMGPANFDEVLKDHQEAARNGDIVHLRLAATIAGIASKGRKRTRANTFGGSRKLSAAAAASTIGRFLFDYNTVEALLLASALLVSLSGVMFGAAGTTASSTFYQQSRDGVLSAVIILVSISILYWLTVVALEITFLVNEQNEAKATAAAGRKAAKKGSKSSRGRQGSDEDEEDEERPKSDFQVGDVEQSSNPLFLKADDPTSDASLGLDLAAVRSMPVVPSQTVWEVLRSTYLATANQVAVMEEEAARLKAELAATKAMGSSGGATAGGARGSDIRAARTPSTTTPRDGRAKSQDRKPSLNVGGGSSSDEEVPKQLNSSPLSAKGRK